MASGHTWPPRQMIAPPREDLWGVLGLPEGNPWYGEGAVWYGNRLGIAWGWQRGHGVGFLGSRLRA